VRRYAHTLAQIVCFLYLSGVAYAQNANPILSVGDAAVAGFSGAIVFGSPPPPEAQRIDKTYIDLDGPALRVIGLARMGGPPQAQFVDTPKSFTATARQIGQVFSLALDDADPPNIYAAATSAYGLPIVVPDADGDGVPDRSRRGAPYAAFMPGLFGPAIADGGPGSIWKIDGRSGAVTLFANVLLNGVRNSGPALGGLAFDPVSHQLFVADRETGMIHRFTLDGVERGRFDHGVQGLTAAQLSPMAFDPRKRINPQNPAFDSTDPATWGYAPIVRRVFALAVHGSRLYYAVASGLRIWSVGIMPDGSFDADARVEVAIPSGQKSDTEISTIVFDSEGRMLLAERDPPTGAYDYKVLAMPAAGRALRLRAKQPGENGTPFYWQADGDYAVGFPSNYTNNNGGLALGYGYDSTGDIDRRSCSVSLWTTGEQLRVSPDRTIASRLRTGGPLAVNGMQRNELSLVRPQNAPPLNSYFLNYADPAEQPGLIGQIGGVVIWQVCPRAEISPEILAGILSICPPGYDDIRGQCVPTSCPPEQRFRDGKCVPECPPLRHALRGECCPRGFIFDGRRCVQPKGPDLTIKKTKAPNCKPSNCEYGIVVTNNGPGTYNGELIVADVASLGQLDAANSNGWVCTNSVLANGNHTITCRRPNTTIAPGQSAPPLLVDLNSGNATGTLLNCAIVDPRGDGNPSNNVSCTPPETRTPNNPHLTILKTAPSSCPLFQRALPDIAYECEFTITVTNDGTGPADNVTVTDTVAAPRNTISNYPNDNNWSCTSTSNYRTSITCQLTNPLPPGATASFKVGVVASPGAISANNCAAIGGQPTAVAPSPSQTGPVQPAPGTNFSPTLGVQQSPSQTGPVQAAPGTNFLPILGLQSCASIALPNNPTPTNPTCVPEHVPNCFCEDVFCHVGECQTCGGCPWPFVGGKCPTSCVPKPVPGCVCEDRFCHAGECQTCGGCATAFVGGKCPAPLPSGGSGGGGSELCADGSPRNNDGNCPPSQFGCPPGTVPVNDGTSCSPGSNRCQRPKILSGGVCVCPEGTVGNDCHKPSECDSDEYLNDAGKCVEKPSRRTRKPRHHKPSGPSSETGQKPNIELNIGIGIGGGGRGGGHPSPGRMPTPGGRGGG